MYLSNPGLWSDFTNPEVRGEDNVAKLRSHRRGRARSGARGNPLAGSEEKTVRSWWCRRWAIGFLLVGATLALYGKSISYPFINFDDEDYVLTNTQVKEGLTWQTVRWSLTAVKANNWHPLTWLSHALDCELFALDPGGPHAVNLLLHTVNVLLLFLMLEHVTKALGRSFLVAALFAWHPFNIESVVWISERKNVLSTLFFFLTLLAYGWYARKPRWERYVLVTGLFALGLASKPMLVTLPIVLLLIDYWPLHRIGIGPSGHFAVPQATWGRLILEKIPLLLMSAASSIVTIFAQQAGGALQSFQALPISIRFETAARAYFLYIAKAIWPFGYALYYPNPFDVTLNQRPGLAEYFSAGLGVVLLLGVSWLAWSQRRSRPYLSAGWFWYVATLVPVIGVVQVGTQAMADRYAYIPLIGIFVVIVWSAAEAGRRLGLASSLQLGFSATVLVAMWVISFLQIDNWRSSYEIWQHARKITANNYIADDKIGVLLFRQRNPAAFEYYQEAARIAPWDPVSNEAVAALLAGQGRIADAVRAYEIVIRGSKDPEVLGLAHSNLGILYTTLGEYDAARAQAQAAMQFAPQRINQEIGQLSEELVRTPAASGYINLAMLFEQTGQIEAARSACQKALDLSPYSQEARKFMDHLMGN